ncbi:ranBP2-type zinc finger protein At1g67325-like isoform X2 [Lolium rigidum]|uniref:ranBP2-type zinc finger protein At1g67325-like isoform X2 n=1 Tax=Lolium rigidum TaxID=89674 RepID=UPI001F5C2E37|nr:ranBP2-type zinc finger protein At1g67325-like isoform X2 [Lolium rigidum]
MASAQMENRGAFGTKRSRNDVSVREGDWSCHQCGNVNFSFRNACNRGSCGAPRPSPSPSPRMMPAPAGGGYDRSPLFYGSAGAPPPHMPNGSASYGSPYPQIGLRYGYGPPVGPPGSYGLLSSYGQPGPMGGPMGGMGYAHGPELGRYGPDLGRYGPDLGRYNYGFRGSPMPVSSPWSGGALVENNDTTASRKRRGGPDGLSEGDWECPTCKNVNFAFRNTCNMKKCGAPRPTSGANSSSARKDKDAPEGSWTCPECNNLNYPFRTVCNRKGCSSDKPTSSNN